MDEWVTLSRVAVQKGAQKDSPKETVGFPEVSADGPERKLTRNQKRKHDEINHVQKVCVCSCMRACVYLQHLPPLPSPQTLEEMDPTTAALEREHEALTKVKYINRVQIGK